MPDDAPIQPAQTFVDSANALLSDSSGSILLFNPGGSGASDDVVKIISEIDSIAGSSYTIAWSAYDPGHSIPVVFPRLGSVASAKSLTITGDQIGAVSFPILGSVPGTLSIMNFGGNHNDGSISLPSLAHVSGALNLHGNWLASGIAFTSLVDLTGTIETGSGDPGGNLPTLTFPALISIAGTLDLRTTDGITGTLNFPVLISVSGSLLAYSTGGGSGDFQGATFPALTTISGTINVGTPHGDDASSWFPALTTLHGSLVVSAQAADDSTKDAFYVALNSTIASGTGGSIDTSGSTGSVTSASASARTHLASLGIAITP